MLNDECEGVHENVIFSQAAVRFQVGQPWRNKHGKASPLAWFPLRGARGKPESGPSCKQPLTSELWSYRNSTWPVRWPGHVSSGRNPLGAGRASAAWLLRRPGCGRPPRHLAVRFGAEQPLLGLRPGIGVSRGYSEPCPLVSYSGHAAAQAPRRLAVPVRTNCS